MRSRTRIYDHKRYVLIPFQSLFAFALGENLLTIYRLFFERFLGPVGMLDSAMYIATSTFVLIAILSCSFYFNAFDEATLLACVHLPFFPIFRPLLDVHLSPFLLTQNIYAKVIAGDLDSFPTTLQPYRLIETMVTIKPTAEASLSFDSPR